MSEETEPAPEAAAPEGERPRALLVEDDHATAHLVERHLAHLGFAVDWVVNGQQAILVSQNHLPALVVMDAMMPRLDGFEATRYLKLRYPGRVPVLMLTALDDAEAAGRAERAGADFYLVKPVRLGPLREAVSLLAALSDAQHRLDAGDAEALDAAIEARLDVAQRLWKLGLARVARGHLGRLWDLAPADPRVAALAERLGA